MKKFLVLVAISIASITFSQVTQRNFDGSIESASAMYRRMDNQRYIGGHKADSKFVFQNTLLKLFKGELNIDSLIAVQPQLPLIIVNEYITDPVYTENAIDFFKYPKFAKYYWDTNNKRVFYDISIIADGYYEESITVITADSGKTLRYIVIQYESYSNQIRLIIDNCYEHLD